MTDTFHYHTAGSHEKVNYLAEFTRIYENFDPGDIVNREISILKHQVPAIFFPPENEDLIAGRILYPPLVFTPQAQAAHGGYGYVYDEKKLNELREEKDLREEDHKTLDDIHNFWIKEDTAIKTRRAYPAEISSWLPSDNWTEESGIAFPLYRMSGSQPDYGKLLRLGIPGLKKLIDEKAMDLRADSKKAGFYRGLDFALDLLSDLCKTYARQLKEASADNTKNQTGSVSQILENISGKPPSGFHEAVQLVHLYALVSGSYNYGRMDDYLAPFLKKDLDSGRINEEEAVTILESFWKQINFRKIIWDGRVITGGQGRKNGAAADKVALLIMEASRRVKDVLPQLTLRCYEEMDERLFSKAMEVISEGNTYPILYNDDVNIPAVAKAFRVPETTAVNYLPFGCGEYILNHRSFGTPSGVINLLKILEISLHEGADPLTGRNIGVPSASEIPVKNYEDLCRVYNINLSHYLLMLARQEKFEYEFAARTAPFLFLSLLFDSCIDKGLAIFDGGIDHLGGTVETYGNTNTADSFLAIKKMVFEKEELSLEELRAILDKNFEGHETIRKKLLDLPKYGNDDPEADEMMMNIHEEVCKLTMKMADQVGLDSYLVVNINNNANAILGRFTAASADGRKAGTPMANGNTPSPGMDKNGATALLNSLAKMRNDIHAGASQNIKFSREMFSNYLPMTTALVRTYFKTGGAQLMITVVGKDDLENALKEPEKYPDLLVRVGGFSARFVELDKDVQMEILQRTLY